METKKKNIKIAKKIEELLFDYDLKQIDDDCLNNISGALLDMFLWARKSKF